MGRKKLSRIVIGIALVSLVAVIMACSKPAPAPSPTPAPAPTTTVTVTAPPKPTTAAPAPTTPKPATPSPTTAPPGWEKTLVFTSGTMWMDGGQPYIARNFFFKEVEKRTQGRLKFKELWGAVLTSEEEVSSVVGKGVLAQLGGPGIAKFFSQAPYWSLLTSPYLWGPNFYLGYDFAHEIIRNDPTLVREMATRQNIKVLQPIVRGPQGVSTNKLVVKPSDLKGMKIRTLGAVDSDILSSFGATPITMPSAQIEESLQRGIVAGLAPIATDTSWLRKFNEVGAPYFLNGVMGMDPTILYLSINIDTWNSLPPDIQKIMEDTTAYTVKMGKERHMQEWQDSINKMKASGKWFVHIPTDEEVRVWKEAIDPVLYKSIEKVSTDLGLKDGLDFVKGMMKKWEEFQKTRK